MVLLLTGCKNAAVKNAEQAINKIGEVTLDSKDLINEAEEYYSSLTDKQKDQVENYKILLEAQRHFDELEQKEEAQKIVDEISILIDELADQPCRKQAEVDELNELYSSLKEEYHNLISNPEQIEKINELTQYESYALSAANEVKTHLKASDSFKLKEVSVIVGNEKAISPYFVSIRYSGTNSFGGEKDASSFVDINAKGESAWWSMSALLGGLEENELLLYNDSLKNKQSEYEIDPERIVRKME